MRQWCLVFCLILLTLPASRPAIAQSQSTAFTVVNAASYGTTIAPDSLATIFGSNLSLATASAALDSNGQLPTVLGQTSVAINGIAASLLFVSPGQINLVVPDGLTAGTATVVVRSTASGSAQSGTALVATTAPGIFSLDASGSGAGAILNAINYNLAPFLVLTDDGASGTATVLAVYGTGLRFAGTVTALAQDSAGNRYSVTVQFAGAAPGFFGLDQVNVLLPPDIDGAGIVSLVLTGDNFTANVVTFQMDFIPAVLVRPALLTFFPNLVTAGSSTALTVGLTGVARAGGYPVGLKTNNAAAPVIAQLAVPPGQASAQTTIITAPITSTTEAMITASGSGVTLTATLEIDPATTVQLATLSVSSGSLLGGRNLTGTVTLNGVAPGGGVNILLASDSNNARVPAVVTVPFGQRSMDFAITTLAVTRAQTVNLTATLSRTTVSVALTLVPPLQLTLEASAVVGGNPVSGTVTLGDPAPATGAIVTLQSADTAAQVQPVIIPAGQSLQTFTVTTSAVTAARTVTISAIYGLLRQTALLTVNPAAAVTLVSLTIAPDHVVGGNLAQGTVTLSGPAGSGGVRVNIQSSSVLTASASPNFVLIPQGQTSATFTITTSRFAGMVTFTATAGGVSQTANLTVQ
jgi:uncharacterized protein (TIGR03437 family)